MGLKDDNEKLQGQIADLRDRCSTLQSQIDGGVNDIQVLAKESNDRKSELITAQKENQDLTNRLALADKRSERITAQSEDRQVRLCSEEQKNASLETENKYFRETNTGLIQSVQDLTASIKKLVGD